MTPKEITTLAGHRLVPPWVMKLALDVAAAEREKQAEQSQLADASLEPVGYFAYDEEHDIWEELTGPNAPGATKLYAAPVRTKDPCNPLQDLTDDEILDVALSIEIEFSKDTDKFVQQLEDIEVFARAIIEKFKEKNQ